MEEQAKNNSEIEEQLKAAEERGRRAGFEEGLKHASGPRAMWEQPDNGERELDVNGDGCEILKRIRPCVWDGV